MDDIAFVSLSLFAQTPIWTGDKILREGLIHKGFDPVLDTMEIQSIRLGKS